MLLAQYIIIRQWTFTELSFPQGGTDPLYDDYYARLIISTVYTTTRNMYTTQSITVVLSLTIP